MHGRVEAPRQCPLQQAAFANCILTTKWRSPRTDGAVTSRLLRYLIENPGGVTQEASSTGFRSVTLKPAHVQGLSGATVTTETQHGVLNFTWERAGGLQCSRTPEDTVSELSCGTNGGTIKRVRFASFGRPTGGCGSFGVDAQCHVDVQSAVEQLCKGKASCSIPATVDAFGVPCTSSEDGAPHRLHVEVECTAPPAVHAAVSIPVTSTATLVLPVAGTQICTIDTIYIYIFPSLSILGLKRLRYLLVG